MLKLLERLENRLSSEYELIEVNREKCFLLPSGAVVHLVAFMDWKAILAEYAENIETAKLNAFEDGDLWYTEEMSEDEIFNSIMEEIRNGER